MTRWADVSTDPNSRGVLVWRRRGLHKSFKGRSANRISLISHIVAGCSVVDLGCVDQVADGYLSAPLHRRLIEVCPIIIGVDNNSSGVRHLREEGLDVRLADVADSVGLVQECNTGWEFVVAGELIEHLDDLGALFKAAASLLDHEGSLLISTPNPFSLTLVLPNSLGLYSDNVDHVCYVHPSGIAELAERHGFELTSWWSVHELTSRKRLVGYILGRITELFIPTSTAGSQSLVYQLRLGSMKT